VREIKVRRLVVALILFLLQPLAFSLRPSKYGAVGDGLADARLLAFELIPVCVNTQDPFM
jgi:hypothetical protein